MHTAQTRQRSDRSTFHIASPQSVRRLLSSVYALRRLRHESGVSVLDGGGVGDDLKRCTGGLQNDRRCSARPNNSKYGLRAPLCDGGGLRSPYPRHTVPRRNTTVCPLCPLALLHSSPHTIIYCTVSILG